jgi:DNA processing protein
MAALAQATVVVEGVSRSGARYVARDALTLQRHMVAVPGPVTSATSALPHELIATGKASLVTCAQDVIDHLAATTITDILGVTEEDQ